MRDVWRLHELSSAVAWTLAMSWHAQILHATDEDDWLEQRRAGIGASDIAKILGVSPYGSAFTVWASKVRGVDQVQTADMSRGKRREDVILEDFTLETGLFVGGRQLFIAHPQFPWARATLDGVAFEAPPADHPSVYGIEDLEHALGVVEAKHDGSFSRWSEIPDHHQLQVQWQLFVSGFDNGWLAVWHSGRFEKYEIERDRGLQNMMLDRASDFRAKHLTGGVGEPIPPDPDGSDATTRAIADLWDADDETIIELSSDMAADVEALRGLQIRASDIEKQIKELKNRIRVSMQEATVGTIGGEVAVTWKPSHRDGYYVEPWEGRRLTIKKGKRNA